MALERGLVIRGTLGVLVEARLAGRLPSVEAAIRKLEASGFRIAAPLVRQVLVRVGEGGGTGE